MSAVSQSMKFKLVEFLKGFFRKFDANITATPATTFDRPAIAAKVSPPAKPVQAASPAGQNGDGNRVQIPLPAILAMLPLELRGRVVQQADVTDLKVPVAIDKILSQLGNGVVKVAFGEIRQAAPRVFSASTSCDQVGVILPLAEILARLNPALLGRRSAQKHVTVPAEISSPFGAQGQGLIFSIGKAKTATTGTSRFSAPVAPLAPATPVAPLAPATPVARSRSPFAQPTASVPDQIFQCASISPVAPGSPVKPALPVLPTPTPSPMLPPRPKGLPTAMHVARLVQPVQPTQPVRSALPVPVATEVPGLSVSLSALTQGWPDALRQEIVQLNLSEARLVLPTRLVEAALKRGRVVFAWKVLRSWIRPTPAANVSVHDGAELELPLSVLAPLFIARQKAEAKPQQHVAIDENIPNLFFGLPKPEPVTAPAPAKPPVNKVVDTNYYVWDDVSDTARVDEGEFKRTMAGGTDFVAKYATPNEIVSRAAALDSVAGALIALPDGLMVASRIPPDLNGDTLAAFLPQIFAKVSQTTKELRMGDLNNLNFTVGNVPWKIFRVNAIFFAAFGRAGEALPTGPLAALAGELDRKNK